jgi:N-acetyl-anhydromuramyl-L-alanine amidase AmpD
MRRSESPNKLRPGFASQLSVRTKAVWVTLSVAMAGVTSLLVVLDPDSSFARGGVNLPVLAASVGTTSMESIFQTRSEEQPWKAIVIHHAAAPYATAQSLDQDHRRRGLAGLGHHFIVGNGNGLGDGEIHVGYRWLDQLPGAHAAGDNGDWYNRNAIGIVLVGNGDLRGFSDRQLVRLTDLVSELCRRYSIPPESVVLHGDIAPTTSPGRLFPAAAFHEALNTGL